MWSPLSPMVTLLTAPTNIFEARFYKIDPESKRLSSWHVPASDRWYIFCFKDSNKTFTFFFWKKKKLHLKSFFTQTHFEIRAHKSWHYFILLCASVKELRYDTATKNWWLWNRETWQHFISFMFWLYVYQKTCISSSSARNW